MYSDEPRKVNTYGVIGDGFCAVSAAALSWVTELYAERVALMATSPSTRGRRTHVCAGSVQRLGHPHIVDRDAFYSGSGDIECYRDHLTTDRGS